MKIAFFTDGFPPQANGVATTVYEAMEALIRHGHEVVVVAPKYPNYKDKSNNVYRISSIPMSKNPDVRLGLTLPEKEIREMNFDLIHGHSGGPISFLGWEIARAKNIPYVLTYHTLWNKYTHYFLKGTIVKPKMMELATRVFGNRSDMILAPSKRVAKELKSYGVKAPIEVVPSGIDTSHFKGVKKGFLRQELKLKKESRVLLFVGRLGREKSVDFLLSAFSELNFLDAVLVIVGDGPEKKNLKTLAKNLKIDDKTFFLGEVEHDDIPRVYADADVFVFSSKSETQGMVIPEALASGLPVVALSDPTIAEFVRDGRNGFIAEDKKDFVEKIQFLLSTPKYSLFSDEAKKSASLMDSQRNIKKLLQAYKKTVANYRRDHLIRYIKRSRIYEEILLLNVFFWLSILTIRILVNIDYYDGYLPIIFTEIINTHHLWGIFIALLCFFTFMKNGRFSLLSLSFLGIGLGLFVDNFYSIFTGNFLKFSFFEYWSFGNLITIIVLGVLFAFIPKALRLNKDFARFKEKKRLPQTSEIPTVTVVIPALNEEKFISRTLESLVGQTYKKFEVIVVDNNSFDKTIEISEDYGARVVMEYKKGAFFARKKGVFESRGKIIAFTTAGTILPQNWLQGIVSEFEKKNVVAYGGMTRLYSGPVTARLASRYLGNLLWLKEILSGSLNLNVANMAIRKDDILELVKSKNSELQDEEELTKRLKSIGKVVINKNFIVFCSGRKYRRGYLYGIATSVSSDVSRIMGMEKQEIFPAREEKSFINKFSFVPLFIGVGLLLVMFSSFNPNLSGAKKVIIKKGGVSLIEKKIKNFGDFLEKSKN